MSQLSAINIYIKYMSVPFKAGPTDEQTSHCDMTKRWQPTDRHIWYERNSEVRSFEGKNDFHENNGHHIRMTCVWGSFSLSSSSLSFSFPLGYLSRAQSCWLPNQQIHYLLFLPIRTNPISQFWVKIWTVWLFYTLGRGAAHVKASAITGKYIDSRSRSGIRTPHIPLCGRPWINL